MGRGLTRVLDALRPHPHRGDVIAAGAVTLTAALLMIDVRMSSQWEDGAMLALFGLGALVVYGMGLLAPLEGGSPRAYQSILLLSGLALAAGALVQLALVLGAQRVTLPLTDYVPGLAGSIALFGPIDELERGPSPGALAWVAAALACIALLGAVRANSAACTLVAAVAAGVAVVAFVELVFAPEGNATMRWILLLVIVGYVAGLAYLRERHRHHAVMMVNAAGLAIIAIALSFEAGIEGVYFNSSGQYGGGFSIAERPGFGWDVVLLLGSFGLIAYAAADNEPGPGVLGAIALLASVVAVGLPGFEATLVGWPLFLLVVGIAGILFGLRPRRELPPPPDRDEREAETRPMPPPTSL